MSLTAAPMSNAKAALAPWSTVMVSVSPPLEGRSCNSVNLLAVWTPKFAEISTRGCGCDCAAADVAHAIEIMSNAAARTISHFGDAMRKESLLEALARG